MIAFQAFVVRKKSIVELESDMLNGQKLQGPETAAEVMTSINRFVLTNFVQTFCDLGEPHVGQQRPRGRVSSVYCSAQGHYKCHQHVQILLLHKLGLLGRTGARATDRSHQESSSSCVIKRKSLTISLDGIYMCVSFSYHMFICFYICKIYKCSQQHHC